MFEICQDDGVLFVLVLFPSVDILIIVIKRFLRQTTYDVVTFSGHLVFLCPVAFVAHAAMQFSSAIKWSDVAVYRLVTHLSTAPKVCIQ